MDNRLKCWRQPISLLLLCAACLLSVGCAVELSYRELGEALDRQELASMVVTDDAVVVSPYSDQRTQRLVQQVERNLRLVSRALEVELEKKVTVVFSPLEQEAFRVKQVGDEIRFVGGYGRPTRRGVRGHANPTSAEDGPSMVIYVAKDRESQREDGRRVLHRFDHDYESTIRHEITHVCAWAAGLKGPVWFDEGVAFELQTSRVLRNRLIPGSAPKTIAIAREIHREISLRRVLEWSEDTHGIEEGHSEVFKEGRPLAHALLRFLFSRLAAGSLRDKLDVVYAMSQEEILALEPDWHAWLDAWPQSR